MSGGEESMMTPRIGGRTVGGAGIGCGNHKFAFGPVKFEKPI